MKILLRVETEDTCSTVEMDSLPQATGQAVIEAHEAYKRGMPCRVVIEFVEDKDDE